MYSLSSSSSFLFLLLLLLLLPPLPLPPLLWVYSSACLGEGTYAVVFSAALRTELALYNEVDEVEGGRDGAAAAATGPEYRFAVKVLPRAFRGSFFAAGFLEKELAILRRVAHPSILSLSDSTCTEDALVFVTERALGGDLFGAITRHHNYNEKVAQQIFRRLLDAVCYLHEDAKIIHRDLKPENILLMEDSDDCASVRICDFGVSKMWETRSVAAPDGGREEAEAEVGNDTKSSTTTSKSSVKRATMHMHIHRRQPPARGGSPQLRTRTITGTPGYQAPEILDDSTSYGTAVDLWSLGIILHTMLCGYLPERVPPSMSAEEDEVWARVSDEAKDLVRALLSPMPDRRPTAREALECEWLQNGTPRRPAAERSGKRLMTEDDDVPARASSARLSSNRAGNIGGGAAGTTTRPSRSRSVDLWSKVRDRLKLKSKSGRRFPTPNGT